MNDSFAAGLVIALLANALFRGWLHWPWQGAGLAAVAVGIASGAVIRVTRHLLAKPAPSELALEISRLTEDGYRKARIHPLSCTRRQPHAHMVSPAGKPVVLTCTGWMTTEIVAGP